MNPIFLRFLSALFFAFFVCAVASCGGEDATLVVTEEEAAEAIGMAMSGKTAGGATQLENLADLAFFYSGYCSESFDTTLAHANTVGAITFDYSFEFTGTVTCNAFDLPTQINANLAAGGNYDGLRMSSSDLSTATLTVTDLTNPSEYTINGTAGRSGTQQSKIKDNAEFQSTISLTYSNVKVNIIDQEIVSGTASATITGEVSDGENFTYSGTVTFLGNQTLNVTLNSGATYTFSW